MGRKECQNNLEIEKSDFSGFVKKFPTLVKGLISITFKYKRMTHVILIKFDKGNIKIINNYL